jgi:UDP-3-O-[3-hydroxymyristoyl] glucosamine N-acyltransferase
MEFTVKQIAQLLGGEVQGDESLKINKLAKIDEGTAGSVSFLANLKYEAHLYSTNASAVIVDRAFRPKDGQIPTLILVENAYSAFSTLLEEYQKIVKFSKSGIEQPSSIGSGTTLGTQVYVGAFAYIGQNCSIGNNVKIAPQAYIGDGVSIGDNTIIEPGVRIYSQTIIGKYCTIKANAVIGSDGFGFAPQADGTYRAIPQLGNVVIEDYVSIGANTTIDCATLGSTLIREGVKLDNLIQVAHNVEIGKHTVVAAQTGISGSTKIGEYCMIGGQVGFAGHISLANKIKVTAQTGVAKSFSKENIVLGGYPATENADYLRSQTIYRRLPQLEKRLSTLEAYFKELTLTANQ